MARRDYMNETLEWLLNREWSSRHKGLYFACPSCGARWYNHCQGCKLERAIETKKRQMSISPTDTEPSDKQSPLGIGLTESEKTYLAYYQSTSNPTTDFDGGRMLDIIESLSRQLAERLSPEVEAQLRQELVAEIVKNAELDCRVVDLEKKLMEEQTKRETSENALTAFRSAALDADTYCWGPAYTPDQAEEAITRLRGMFGFPIPPTLADRERADRLERELTEDRAKLSQTDHAWRLALATINDLDLEMVKMRAENNPLDQKLDAAVALLNALERATQLENQLAEERITTNSWMRSANVAETKLRELELEYAMYRKGAESNHQSLDALSQQCVELYKLVWVIASLGVEHGIGESIEDLVKQAKKLVEKETK